MAPRGKKGAQSAAAVAQTFPSGVKLWIPVKEAVPKMFQIFEANCSHLHTFDENIPVFPQTVPQPLRSKQITFENQGTFVKWAPSADPRQGVLTLQTPAGPQEIRCFEKQIPLLEPLRWMRYKVRPTEPFFWKFQRTEINQPQNQAQVDAVGSMLVAQLRRIQKTPHFAEAQGGFRAISKTFLFNIEDDFDDVRFTRWFWQALDDGEFGLRIVEKQSGHRLTMEEIRTLFRPDAEQLHEESRIENDEADEDDDDESSEGDGVLSGDDITGVLGEEVVLDSVEMCDMESVQSFGKVVDKDPIQLVRRAKSEGGGSHTNSSGSTGSTCSWSDTQTLHAELYNMPVFVLQLEQLEGTMDELMLDEKQSPIENSEMENIWTAWLFQVVAALSQLQNWMNLTHNDLHTNNVLWKTTAEEFLWQRDSLGRTQKVPTQGKLFHIIDQGRAIFTINNQTCISSDQEDGHEAEGQQNFGPIQDETQPKVLPNKSFDLCRLVCSLLRGIFPENPTEKPKGAVLTQEDGVVIRETLSPLFNLLWTWQRTKVGESILELPNGHEKQPGFDLQIRIAADVKDAVPGSQFSKPIFADFQVQGALPANCGLIYVPL